MTELQKSVCMALNDHANRQIYATHVYLHAAYWFDQKNYDGIANFLKKEAEEQHKYALKIYEYIHLRQGGAGLVTRIPQAVSKWDTPQAVFASLLNLEKDFYTFVSKIRSSAAEFRDHGTYIFLGEIIPQLENSVREWLRLYDEITSYEAIPALLWHLNEELD